ncbi:TonB-dependent receptor plug domain-containing protein [Massilia cellulosiltytica]|uniref:TonB-dependent receptor plug domain-containing protein n=1 Tax=Massilia cellulosiltytica TaxID=2683234 RepID=UPI0039B63D32
MLPNKETSPSRHLSRAIGLLAAGFQAGALAQQGPDLNALPLEQLLNLEVVTASKIPQKISEAPSSVTVITAEDIRQRGYRTLTEVLQSVPGMTVSYDRNYNYANIRGLGNPGDLNTRLLVLIDGRRLNDVVYDQGAIGTEFPIDLALIDRVEFVPGPGSAIYGSSAFFGVVNVLTKSGGALNGQTVSVGRFTGRGREVRNTYGSGTPGGTELLLGASVYDSPGRDVYFPEYDDAASNHGVAAGIDYDRYRRLFAKLSAGGVVAEAYFGSRTKGIPTASYGQQFNDPRSWSLDEYAGAALSWHRAVSETLDLFAGVSVARYRYKTLNVTGSASEGPTPGIDTAESLSSGAEVRVTSSALRGHKLIAGAEYTRDSKRQMANYDVDPYLLNLDVAHPKRQAAVYLQDEMRLGEKLILNTGVRHDYDSEGGATTNPRVALLYKTASQVTLKALYGTAFRSANAYERYYTFDFRANPALRSEHIKTYELIAEYFPTDRFRATASVFQYRMRDMLALATDPVNGMLVFSNIEAARATGIEVEAEWLREDGSALKGSANVQSARNDAGGAWLPNSPRRLFKLNYALPPLGDHLRAHAEYRYTSRRRTVRGGEVGGFGLVDLNLVGTLGSHVELSAGVLNVFAKRFADSASEEHYDNSTPPRHLDAIGQDGRTLRFMATVRF